MGEKDNTLVSKTDNIITEHGKWYKENKRDAAVDHFKFRYSGRR